MALLSLTAYGASHSASRQAAAKWKKSGILVFSGEMVDAAASDLKMRAAGLGRFKTEAAEAHPTPATTPATDPRNQRAVAPEIRAAVDEVVADLKGAADQGEIDEEIAGGFIEQLLKGEFRSKAEANAIKENALALKHLLAAQKEADRLVEIEVAEQVLFKDRRAARDAWQAWASRFAPLIAADLDIDGAKLAEALKPYVQQQLEELGDPDLDWTDPDEG